MATELAPTPAPGEPPRGMVWIPGGDFSMGSTDPTAAGHCHEPMADARPIHRVRVAGFFMDATEVTNESFAAFVKATGYVTLAERAPTAAEFPGAPASALVAGSAVFTPTADVVPLDQPLRWWRYQPGADWRHPTGPGSSLAGKERHPVVHVTYSDAQAYAKWAGKDLPTEAEWEFAARGGEAGKLYPWGDRLKPGGQFVANIFQGTFPVKDLGEDGFVGSAPVASFPPNAFGLYDLAGNVWEWTRDWYRADEYARQARDALTTNPQGPEDSFDPSEPGTKKRVQRGGSFLCTSEYCTRYMVGTRGKGEPESPAGHIGFRCVRRG
ncbi:MAG TPA: formylglycine-generating enzyme family protein [Polyangiaceae bacterium]|nr:formylglycine-generating enzyme family protein [Polyangiaceae bacterium]